MAEFGKHADKPEVFKQALDPHIAYLEARKDKVLLSATRYATEGKEVLGFVWIIEAEDAEEAERICREDPFWTAGLRTSFHLCRLTKALPHYVASI
ncbi:MAG: YciI family protein [bacterium]